MMTSLQDYYYGYSHTRISPKSKEHIHHAVFSHINIQNNIQPKYHYNKSLRYRLSNYQLYLTPSYLYAGIIILIIIGSFYTVDISPQISYRSLGPLIATDIKSSNQVYANQLGTIISTVGQINIVHQGKNIDTRKLYGNDTILLSNQSYVIFTLMGGYIGSISGPAKIELQRMGDTYKINVIEGTILTLKSQVPSPAKIQISASDFTLMPQGSTDLVIAKYHQKMVVQNHATSNLIVKDANQNSNLSDQIVFIIPKQSVHLTSVDGNITTDTLSSEEAKILIAQLQTSSISQTYNIDPSLISPNLLSDMQNLIGSSQTSFSKKSALTFDADIDTHQNNANPDTIILATIDKGQDPIDQKKIDNVSNLNMFIDQAQASIKQISMGQSLQTTNLSADEIGLKNINIKPLLQYDANTRIIKMLDEIRNHLDMDTPNIDLINENIILMAQSLLITPPTIIYIDQLPQSIATIEHELSTYTIDPKLIYQINHVRTAYQRYLIHQQQSQIIQTNTTVDQASKNIHILNTTTGPTHIIQDVDIIDFINLSSGESLLKSDANLISGDTKALTF